MSDKTKIQWCDSTINFWSGCTKVSAGCQNCYAERLSDRFVSATPPILNPKSNYGFGRWGKGAPRRWHESAIKLAHKLNRKPWVCDDCEASFDGIKPIQPHGDPRLNDWCQCESIHRRRVFVNSLSDWLDPEVPVEWLARLLDTIRQCQEVTWILCTKRPELWASRICAAKACVPNGEPWVWLNEWEQYNRPPSNVIILTSVEDQQAADQRVPHLLRIPAACRGLSLEPLLGPVDLTCVRWKTMNDHHGKPQPDHYEDVLRDGGTGMLTKIDWLIIGGESGRGARPCNVEWIRSLVSQGKAAGVPLFVKQLGGNPTVQVKPPTEVIGGRMDGLQFDGRCRVRLKDPKGADPSEWPEDLRVREWPKV